MFAFAFIADSVSPQTCASAVEKMLDGWPFTRPEIRTIASSPTAAAGVLCWVVSGRDSRVVPIWDVGRSLLAVGDVRLYNRPELIRQLGIEPNEEGLPDLTLAYRAYLRWGAEVARRLRGDFAFVVWDENRRSVFAVRDHLGVRPLFYRVEGRRILVGTDVAQIVGASGERLVIDAHKVAEYLLGSVRRRGRTYFRDICALSPGHQLWFEAGRIRTERYWSPPQERMGIAYRDECEEVRSLFVAAVRSRLESSRPIVAHSSGGFDSSTIVMVANSEYRHESGRPPVILASALTPGMPCDDSRYMGAVADRVAFERCTWNALDGPAVDEYEGISIASPDYCRGIGGGAARDLEVARIKGAGVLLTGLCGDTVLFSFGVTRDLARRGRFIELLRQARSGRSTGMLIRTLGRASLGALPPSLALRALDRWNNRSRSGPPAWMGPQLRQVYPLPASELDLEGSHRSHMAAEIWARLTGPATASLVLAMVRWGARAGLEVRIPYLDVALVERILEIPWLHRSPRGDPRRLGRDALGHLLPREFEGRRDQGPWTRVWEHHARRALPALKRLLAEGEWLSAPFVSKISVAALLCSAERGGSQDLVMLAEFGLFEAWLRYVFRTVKCDI